MTDNIQHSLACTKALEKFVADLHDYVIKWPHHCKKCGGWGTIGSGIEDRDTGIVDISPCTDCTENNLCPRCGEHSLHFTEKGQPYCLNCMWTEEDGGESEPPDCDCWLDDLDFAALQRTDQEMQAEIWQERQSVSDKEADAE
jgi:hypothetical protein